MPSFRNVIPWVPRVVLGLCTAVFVLISLQPLLHPAASASAQGIALTSHVGATIFRVSFAGLPLGCAAYLGYCLASGERTYAGLIFSALLLTMILLVRIYGMAVDASTQQSMPLVLSEIVLIVLALAAIALERRSHPGLESR